MENCRSKATGTWIVAHPFANLLDDSTYFIGNATKADSEIGGMIFITDRDILHTGPPYSHPSMV